MITASPPTPKAKIKLSMSNPVACAKLKSDGGFQYSGTKSGSVNPSSEVHKLTKSISLLLSLFFKEKYTVSHITINIELQINQAYCILLFSLEDDNFSS